MNKEWLEGLKAGDKVVVHGRHYNHILDIARLTPTQFVLSDGSRFSRKDGYKIGSANNFYGRNYIGQITAKILDDIKREKLLSIIDKVNLKLLSSNKLESIVEILNHD